MNRSVHAPPQLECTSVFQLLKSKLSVLTHDIYKSFY